MNVVTLDFPILFQPGAVATLGEAVTWVDVVEPLQMGVGLWIDKQVSGWKTYVVYCGSFFLRPPVTKG